jgi:hypothetical protein
VDGICPSGHRVCTITDQLKARSLDSSTPNVAAHAAQERLADGSVTVAGATVNGRGEGKAGYNVGVPPAAMTKGTQHLNAYIQASFGVDLARIGELYRTASGGPFKPGVGGERPAGKKVKGLVDAHEDVRSILTTAPTVADAILAKLGWVDKTRAFEELRGIVILIATYGRTPDHEGRKGRGRRLPDVYGKGRRRAHHPGVHENTAVRPLAPPGFAGAGGRFHRVAGCRNWHGSCRQ